MVPGVEMPNVQSDRTSLWEESVYTSSLGRCIEDMPEHIQKVWHQLLTPSVLQPGHSPTAMDLEGLPTVLWELRNEFGLNDQLEKVNITRGSLTYHLVFHPDGYGDGVGPYKDEDDWFWSEGSSNLGQGT
jgi:hypothetical protein